jgi:hypothetical protein
MHSELGTTSSCLNNISAAAAAIITATFNVITTITRPTVSTTTSTTRVQPLLLLLILLLYLPCVVGASEELIAHDREDIKEDNKHYGDIDDREECLHDHSQQHTHCFPRSGQLEDA